MTWLRAVKKDSENHSVEFFQSRNFGFFNQTLAALRVAARLADVASVNSDEFCAAALAA